MQDFIIGYDAPSYINGFRDEEKFMKFCRECKNYAKVWCCPPFSFDTKKKLQKYKNILLIATKIIPFNKNIPYSETQSLILPERKRLSKLLLEMERSHGGISLAYAGSCIFCNDNSCTRAKRLPCRHPEMVRPSLEAFGFDIGKTLAELFDMKLIWGKNGMLPEYLTLVCGYFSNCDLKDIDKTVQINVYSENE